MKKRVIIAVILVGFASTVGAIIYIMGLYDYIPQLRASAVSPDGRFSVKVYQKRLMPRPFFPRMGATAEVYDRSGNLIYEKLIYNDDDWDDAVSGFNEISFESNEIHIGPGAYNPDNIHKIKISDLKPQVDK